MCAFVCNREHALGHMPVNLCSTDIQNATHKMDLVEVSCFQKPDVRENPGALAAMLVHNIFRRLNQ